LNINKSTIDDNNYKTPNFSENPDDEDS